MSFPILMLLSEVVNFISGPPQGKENVLIHCRLGRNRCVAIAMAILMTQRIERWRQASRKTTPEDLLKEIWVFVSKKRGMHVCDNQGFQRQLLLFAHLLIAG